MCVCVTFVVFTDCESCTRPISTNLGSMETGEYGQPRGTCFVARRQEVVAVAGLLWILWCAFGAATVLCFLLISIFLQTQPTQRDANMRSPCLIYLSTSAGVRTGCHYVCPSVCQYMRNIRRFYRLRELYEADFYKPGITRWSRSPGCCGFRGVFSVW